MQSLDAPIAFDRRVPRPPTPPARSAFSAQPKAPQLGRVIFAPPSSGSNFRRVCLRPEAFPPPGLARRRRPYPRLPAASPVPTPPGLAMLDEDWLEIVYALIGMAAIVAYRVILR